MNALLLALLAAIAPVRDLSGHAAASATLATASPITLAFTVPRYAGFCDSLTTMFAHADSARLIRYRQSPTWVRYHDRMLSDRFVWAVYWPICRAEAMAVTEPAIPLYPEDAGQLHTITSPDSGWFNLVQTHNGAGWSCASNEVFK